MSTSRGLGSWILGAFLIVSAWMMIAPTPSAQASTAYGTLNNFDCVNDTGVEAHGFEIELDDVRSADITYTYDYNHYGIPKSLLQNASIFDLEDVGKRPAEIRSW